MEMFMLIFWIALIVVLLIIEALTVQLVTVWFALGALAALIARICNASILLQWVIFVAVSAVMLAATRPVVRKITAVKAQPTNADRCIGSTAVVTEDINNIAGIGRVEVNGISWSARSSDGSVFKKDELVTVERIDGVKLIVKSQSN